MIMRYKKGKSTRVSKNFSSREFDCKCKLKSCEETLIDTDHVIRLQILRNLVGPLKVTSAYRCTEHNRNVGGGTRSQHLLGTATDLQPLKTTLSKLFKMAKIIDFPGIGDYPTFVHTDSRDGRKSRWSGQGGIK